MVHRGDVVWVEGFPGKTKVGELSLIVRNLCILAPCLHDIPRTIKDVVGCFLPVDFSHVPGK